MPQRHLCLQLSLGVFCQSAGCFGFLSGLLQLFFKLLHRFIFVKHLLCNCRTCGVLGLQLLGNIGQFTGPFGDGLLQISAGEEVFFVGKFGGTFGLVQLFFKGISLRNGAFYGTVCLRQLLFNSLSVCSLGPQLFGHIGQFPGPFGYGLFQISAGAEGLFDGQFSGTSGTTQLFFDRFSLGPFLFKLCRNGFKFLCLLGSGHLENFTFTERFFGGFPCGNGGLCIRLNLIEIFFNGLALGSLFL